MVRCQKEIRWDDTICLYCIAPWNVEPPYFRQGIVQPSLSGLSIFVEGALVWSGEFQIQGLWLYKRHPQGINKYVMLSIIITKYHFILALIKCLSRKSVWLLSLSCWVMKSDLTPFNWCVFLTCRDKLSALYDLKLVVKYWQIIYISKKIPFLNKKKIYYLYPQNLQE